MFLLHMRLCCYVVVLQEGDLDTYHPEKRGLFCIWQKMDFIFLKILKPLKKKIYFDPMEFSHQIFGSSLG